MSNVFAARFRNEPALVCPEMSYVFSANLAAVESKFPVELTSVEMSTGEDFWTELGEHYSWLRPYVVQDGILIIPVKGVLLNNFPYQFGNYATGYEYIQRAVERGMGDLYVKGIALAIDSPGGMVAGNFDLVDRIFGMRGQKPIRAYASESAYSAAYSIASVADSITVSRTGGVGSIGVVTNHTDVSKMMDEAGYKITFIYAGKHKVDGNPYQQLPDDVKGRIQERINALYDIFVATVARNRGMDEKLIRETEALTFTAPEAVSNGLADAIGPLDDAVVAFATELSNNQGDETMSIKKEDNTAVDQAAVETARNTGLTEGHAAGVKAERERIGAIMALAEAAERKDAAFTMALTTDLSVEQCSALLAKLPKEGAVAADSRQGDLFVTAMNNSEHPNLGTDAPKQEAVTDKDSILAAYRKAV